MRKNRKALTSASDLEFAIAEELAPWFTLQTKQPSLKFYLYWREQTETLAGDFMIASENSKISPSYKLAMPEPLNGFAVVGDNYKRIKAVLFQLPILSKEGTVI